MVVCVTVTMGVATRFYPLSQETENDYYTGNRFDAGVGAGHAGSAVEAFPAGGVSGGRHAGGTAMVGASGG